MLLIASLTSCWTAVGLLMLSRRRAEPRTARNEPDTLPRAALRWLLRALGVGALALSACMLAPGSGLALMLVALLLGASAMASVAALVAAPYPRLYASSVSLAALTAAVCWGWA